MGGHGGGMAEHEASMGAHEGSMDDAWKGHGGGHGGA